MNIPVSYRKGKKLETLVENRTTYHLSLAEMNLFETHEVAEKVLLDFDQPVLASMLQGKKIMHLRDQNPFAFLPGESVMLPANELMCIDFPEANLDNPTKCLALAIDENKISQVAQIMNEKRPKVDDNEWFFCDYNFHFANDIAIHQIIQRLVFLCTENHPSKDLFVDMMLSELLIRVLQTESRHGYLKDRSKDKNNDRISYVVNYIRDNIREKLSIKELSQKAYMSESRFYRVFKNELGISPVEFINEVRLEMAARLLLDPSRQVNEVYMECGFNSLSYFNRMFKRKHEMTPSLFQTKMAEG